MDAHTITEQIFASSLIKPSKAPHLCAQAAVKAATDVKEEGDKSTFHAEASAVSYDAAQIGGTLTCNHSEKPLLKSNQNEPQLRPMDIESEQSPDDVDVKELHVMSNAAVSSKAVSELHDVLVSDNSQYPRQLSSKVGSKSQVYASPQASKSHRCSSCQYETANSSHLKIHIDTVHHRLKPFKCTFCEYASVHKKRLKEHVDHIHIGIKPYKCEYCDYATAHASDLRRHFDCNHSGLKPHKCHYCEYATAISGHLKNHIDTVHKGIKPFKCNLCNWASVHKKRLKEHIDSVHNGLKPYKCDACSYATAHEADLKRHIDGTHRGIKPHKCEHCPYASIHASHLKSHVDAVHLGLKPFKCKSCDYSTAHKRRLTQHFSKMHIPEDLKRTQLPEVHLSGSFPVATSTALHHYSESSQNRTFPFSANCPGRKSALPEGSSLEAFSYLGMFAPGSLYTTEESKINVPTVPYFSNAFESFVELDKM